MTRWYSSHHPLLVAVVVYYFLVSLLLSTTTASAAAASTSSAGVDLQEGVILAAASPVCDSAEAAEAAANGTGAAATTTTTAGTTSTASSGDSSDNNNVDLLLQAALGQLSWLERRVGKSSQLNGYWNHDKITLRRQDPKNPEKSSIGIFAHNDIEEGELLMRIPSTAIITGAIPPSATTTPDDGEDLNKDDIVDHTDHNSKEHWLNCNVIDMLAKQLMKQQHVNMGIIDVKADDDDDDDLGEDYSGYANYLLHQPKGQVPSDWSDSAMMLVLDVMGYQEPPPPTPPTVEEEVAEEESDDDEEEEEEPANGMTATPPMISPDYMVDYDYEFVQVCNGGVELPHDAQFDGHEQYADNMLYFRWRAALFLVQRGWDYLFVPVLDMINHHNSPTKVNIADPHVNSINTEEDDIVIYSSRKIHAGEELFSDYRLHGELHRYTNFFYSTQEILTLHGFVEDYPRRFHFEETRYDEDGELVDFDNIWDFPISFEIDYVDEGAGESSSSPPKKQLKWISKKPSQAGQEYLRYHLQRMKDLTPSSYNFANNRDNEDESLLLTNSPYYNATSISSFEMFMIKEFYFALMEAMEMALDAIEVVADQKDDQGTTATI